MTEKKVKYICDRCGVVEEMDYDPVKIYAYPHGWRMRMDRDFCPDCAAKFDKDFKEFIGNKL